MWPTPTKVYIHHQGPGEHLTSFGQCGSNKSDFYHPCGVNVDTDGLLYVGDINNQRLQIF